jgi:hypothetical protein
MHATFTKRHPPQLHAIIERNHPLMATKRTDHDGYFDDDSWDDIEDSAVDFGTKFKFGTDAKKGEIVQFTGRFVAQREQVNSENGDIMNASLFTNADGEPFFCWTPAQVLSAIRNRDIEPDDVVRLTLTGERKSDKPNQSPMGLFEIKVKKPSN